MAVSLLAVGTVGAVGSVYGGWTLSGANPSWTGTLDVSAVGFPSATYTTNSNTPMTPSGVTTFLGTGTPFGAVFGSSQGVRYLNLRTSAGNLTSITTMTFSSSTPPSGWGFAVFDVDADQVTITAVGPSGPLAPAALGFQGGFNLCVSSPRPPSCDQPPFVDVPVWDPTSGTLAGNGANTDGPAAWFRPSAAIESLTFTYSPLGPSPSIALHFASLTSVISGSVVLQTDTGPAPPPAGTVLLLQTPDGQPILDPTGSQVTITPTADGSFNVPNAVATAFSVAVVPPDGYQAVGTDRLSADATSGDLAGLDFVLQQTPTTTTTSTTTTTTTTTIDVTTTTAPVTTTTAPVTSTVPPTPPDRQPPPTTAPGPTVQGDAIANTGARTDAYLQLAVVLLCCGGLLVLLSGGYSNRSGGSVRKD
jgi:hypothetical protein